MAFKPLIGGVSEDALTIMGFGHNISEKWTYI